MPLIILPKHVKNQYKKELNKFKNSINRSQKLSRKKANQNLQLTVQSKLKQNTLGLTNLYIQLTKNIGHLDTISWLFADGPCF